MSQPVNHAAVLADLQAVCRRHGVALIGTCMWEGINGEIQIVEASTANSWQSEDPDQLKEDRGNVYVTAIGAPEKQA